MRLTIDDLGVGVVKERGPLARRGDVLVSPFGANPLVSLRAILRPEFLGAERHYLM